MKKIQIYKIISLWLPVLFWAYLIFYFSSIPGLGIEASQLLNLLVRKTAHIIEYAALYLLLFRAFKGSLSSEQNIKSINAISALLCFIYALSDEFHQSFIPTRGAAVMDIMFDCIGIFLAYYSLSWYLKRKFPQEQSCSEQSTNMYIL